MKIIGSLAILALSLAAHAGPEEHQAAPSCYQLQREGHVYVPASVPAEICLESLKVDASSKSIAVESSFQPEYFKALQVTSLSPRNESGFLFQAESVLSNHWEACSEGEAVKMILAGQVDSAGAGKPDALTVAVQVDSSWDVCHSPTVEQEVFNYQRR